jgi:hypothetical protein
MFRIMCVNNLINTTYINVTTRILQKFWAYIEGYTCAAA